MGSRAYAELWCKPEDREAFEDYGFAPEFAGDDEAENFSGRALRLVNEEADLGLFGDEEFTPGKPFVLAQADGGYGMGCWAGVSDGEGATAEWQEGAEGSGYVFTVDEAGEFDADELARFRLFFALLARVRQMVGMEG